MISWKEYAMRCTALLLFLYDTIFFHILQSKPPREANFLGR